MFYIKFGKKGKWQKWSNDLHDDFIQFLPKSFGVLSKDISIKWSANEEATPEECTDFNPWPYDADGQFVGNGPLDL